MMASAALNNKLDLLIKSNTCSRYLVDVLTLLVAHANETDLFKLELRHATPLPAMQGASATAPQEPSDTLAVAVKTYVDDELATGCSRFAATIADQTEGAVEAAKKELHRAAEQSSAGFMVIAEDTLHTYATDLKKMNDIAAATTAKRLRESRQELEKDLRHYRDSMVEQTEQEAKERLDSLRYQWEEDLNRAIEKGKAELHAMESEAVLAVHQLTSRYSKFVGDSMKLHTVEPLLDVHAIMVQTTLCEVRLDALEAMVSPALRGDVESHGERLKHVERSILCGSWRGHTGTEDVRTSCETSEWLHTNPPQGLQSTSAAPMRGSDISTAVVGGSAGTDATASNFHSQRGSGAGFSATQQSADAHRVASLPSMPSVSAVVLEHWGAAAVEQPATTVPLGIELRDDDGSHGGVLIAGVTPGSQAAQHGLQPGDVVLRVGSSGTLTRAEFAQALRHNVVNGTLTMTCYITSAAAVRTLDFQR